MEDSSLEMMQLAVNLVNKSEISSIRQVVTEILNTIKDENSSAKDLKLIIERDPPLCAKLLRLSNSAYYGYPKTISDIQEAIVCIGFDAVRELALNQKVCELFRSDKTIHGYSRASLWRHSTAVAICAKMIYRREFRENGDEAYAAGLLHDLGIIVEDQFFPEMFENALRRMNAEEIELHEAEIQELNVDHMIIGKGIAANWGFPDDLAESMGTHHEPARASKDHERFVNIIYASNYICQREKIGYIESSTRDVTKFVNCVNRLGIKDKAVDIISQELKDEIRRLDEMDWFS